MKTQHQFFFFLMSVRLLLVVTVLLVTNLLTVSSDPANTDYSVCDEPVECGRDNNITLRYPFREKSQPLSCGYPGFELSCDNNGTMLLHVQSLYFRVLKINYSNQTLIVARQDLWNTICLTAPFYDTTFNSDFVFLKESGDVNVILYYGCKFSNESQWPAIPNKFTCNGINLFKMEDALSGPGPGIKCDSHISVPVNREAAEALSKPFFNDELSTKTLRAALSYGFSVRWWPWWPDDGECDTCVRSGGRCMYNWTLKKGFCYVRVNVPSPSPSPDPSAPSQGYEKRLSGQRKYMIMRLTVAITVVLILFLILVWYLKRRQRRSKVKHIPESNQAVENFLREYGSLAPKRYNYAQIKKITNYFREKLGKGGYGTVYKGKLPNGRLVAVKVLIETTSTNGEEFINEVSSISRTSHVNIVNLLGFCYDKKKRALVYEFMPNKSLDNYIATGESDDCNLEWEKRYKIAVGVARGLEYLHIGCNTRIIHFDIKPQNILLDEDFCPKIADFGLARLCKKKQSILSSMIGTRGTIGYISPEVFSRNFGGVSHKSDVYSYGMMVLQMAGGNKIMDTEVAQSSENYFPDKIYNRVVLDKGSRLEESMNEVEEEIARKMFWIGLWCIQTTPSNRPSMSKVVEMLEGSLDSIPMPPVPNLCTTTITVKLSEQTGFCLSFSENEEAGS